MKTEHKRPAHASLQCAPVASISFTARIAASTASRLYWMREARSSASSASAARDCTRIDCSRSVDKFTGSHVKTQAALCGCLVYE